MIMNIIMISSVMQTIEGANFKFTHTGLGMHNVIVMMTRTIFHMVFQLVYMSMMHENLYNIPSSSVVQYKVINGSREHAH